MKKSTIKKYTELFNTVKESGISLSKYCKENNISYSSIRTLIHNLRNQNNENNKEIENLIFLYNFLTAKVKEDIETDDVADISYERDEEGKIKYYVYTIFRTNKVPLTGKFSREEMATIHRLYSYYGDSLTQRVVARHFPELSLVDFKRVLRAFNITKSSAPFPTHYFEEYSEDELRAIQLREKENSFLRKTEEDIIKNNEKLLKQYAQENVSLRNSLNSLTNIKVTLKSKSVYKITPANIIASDNDLILHLSDMHIGARLESGALYPNEWNEKELIRRLSNIISKIASLGHLNTLVINLLGDNLDGMDNQTARRDHFMPQNMDNMEQVNTFINTMVWFVQSIKENNLCNNIKIYSVKEGNHDGTFGYTASVAALACINKLYPEIETTQFTEFFGYYQFKGHQWLICHGKDSKYMKRPMPLNLDDRNKIRLYEYLDSRNITGNGIHVIKGDLHTENINSCLKLDYRNVLSLFGSSDYSIMNYDRNQSGCSYELFIGDNLVRGTFEN